MSKGGDTIISLTTWWSWASVSIFACTPDICAHVTWLVIGSPGYRRAIPIPRGSSLHGPAVSGSPIALASWFPLWWGSPVVWFSSTTTWPDVWTRPLARSSWSPHCVVLWLRSPSTPVRPLVSLRESGLTHCVPVLPWLVLVWRLHLVVPRVPHAIVIAGTS